MKTISIAKLLEVTHSTVFSDLKNIFSKYNINLFIDNVAKDIWMRDFMPFYLDDGSLISYVYNPNYLKNTHYNNLRTTIAPMENHIDLIIDGGNFVRFKKKAIITNKVFKENKHHPKEYILEQIKTKCKLDELILIDKQPYDRYGHSDSLVRWINENTALINDFSKDDEAYKKHLIKTLENHKLNVKKMEYDSSFFDKNRNWGAYLNFLEFDEVVIVPVYGIDEDVSAIKQIKKYFPSKDVVPIKMPNIIKKGGALHCITANC